MRAGATRKRQPTNVERRVDAIARVYQEVTEKSRISQQQVKESFKVTTRHQLPTCSDVCYMCPDTKWFDIEASHGVFQFTAGTCSHCQQALMGWRYCNECKSLHACALFEDGSKNSCRKKTYRDTYARAMRQLDRHDPHYATAAAELVAQRDALIQQHRIAHASWLWRHNAAAHARGTLLAPATRPLKRPRKEAAAAAEDVTMAPTTSRDDSATAAAADALLSLASL